MGILRKTALFCAGGAGYVGLEYLWRGKSHSSMFAAGGLSFLLLGQLDRQISRRNYPLRAVAGSAAITAVELATGLIVNRDHRVWDYREQKSPHFMGQICLGYSLLWGLLSPAAMALYRKLSGGA